MATRKELRRTLEISSLLIFILAVISAALKAFELIENAYIYGALQAFIRSFILFLFLVLFSALQQLRRKVAGLFEFTLSRLISLSGFGLAIGGAEKASIAAAIYLALAIAFTARVLVQGFEVK